MKVNIEPIDIFRFYYFWKDKEEPLYRKINDSNVQDDIDQAFKDYLKYMKVIRNFKKDRTSKVYQISLKYKSKANALAVEALSDELYKQDLLSKNNLKAHVATSKILWLFDRSFIIMDNNTMRALKWLFPSHIDDYETYRNEWLKAYHKYLPQIDNVIDVYSLNKIDAVIIESWFKQRVFDLFLWSIGEKGIKQFGKMY